MVEEWRWDERDAQKISRNLSELNLIYYRESGIRELESNISNSLSLDILCVNVDENTCLPGLLWDFIEIK